MNKVAIVCDSCCSLTKKDASKYDIHLIPTLFYINDVEYNPLVDNLMDYEEYYQKLENKEIVKTSCINPNSFVNAFTPLAQQGYDILYIALSSGLSASYNNAFIAKEMIEEDYNVNVEIVDSMTGSVGILISAFEAVKLRNQGMSALEIKKAIDKNKLNMTSLFTIGSLDHLRRGGRLSIVSAVLGTLLKINPIVTVNDMGKLVVESKHRGRRTATNYLLNSVIQNANKNYTLFIGHTNCKDEANMMKKSLEELGYDVYMDYIDHTMGAHCGPRTIAVFYRNK